MSQLSFLDAPPVTVESYAVYSVSASTFPGTCLKSLAIQGIARKQTSAASLHDAIRAANSIVVEHAFASFVLAEALDNMVAYKVEPSEFSR